MKKIISNAMAFALVMAASTAAAGPHDNKVNQLMEAEVNQWLNDPAVITAVKRQNTAHVSLSQADVDRLDKQWRAQKKSDTRPMIDKVLGNELSQYLKTIAANSNGLYAEIFIMDNKGLNVGQSKLTSDYWQGDEAKWQKTYLTGPDSRFIDEIEYDDSAKRFQIQVSVPIVDPETGSNIGAATIGLAMRQLVLRKVE